MAGRSDLVLEGTPAYSRSPSPFSPATCSIGIGRMMAEGFVRNGAKVYISSRKKEACDETAAELTSLGPGSCHAAPADLSNEDGAVALTQFVASRESKVHVLVSFPLLALFFSLITTPQRALPYIHK